MKRPTRARRSTPEPCYGGAAGTAGVGVCKKGTRTCGTSGAWGPCKGQVLPGQEVCGNNVDEDCDGTDKACCFEKDFGKLTFDCNCDEKALACPAGHHRTSQRYTGTSEPCFWTEQTATGVFLVCCSSSCGGTHDADHTYITCCVD